MNKTKRVAWHKHLKRARREKEKAQSLAHSQGSARGGLTRASSSGVHAQPPPATRPSTASRQTGHPARPASTRP